MATIRRSISSGTRPPRTGGGVAIHIVLLSTFALSSCFADPVDGPVMADVVADEAMDPSTGSTLPWNTEWLMEQLQPLWDVWMSRILVTIAIVVLFDFFASNKPSEKGYRQQPSSQPLMEGKEGEMNLAEEHFSPIGVASKSVLVAVGQETLTKDEFIKDVSEEVTPTESELGAPNDVPNESENVAVMTRQESIVTGDSPGEAPSAVCSSDGAANGSASAPSTKPPRPRITATSNQHPGMMGFAQWYDVETSLYRIYTLTRKDGVQVVPPYIPSSHRGTISISLHVTNCTYSTINVYWVDYKGNQVPKGMLKPNHVWTQTTWIDHPWVFEDAFDSTPLLYYIPYRAIPTLPSATTVSDVESVGQHKFSLIASRPNDEYIVGVNDEIMPHPALTHFHQPLYGITWTLTHMSRSMDVDDPHVDTLQKYLTNILRRPEVVKYRQLRIASTHFAPIWQSPMRGLLLAVGFVDRGMYAELGCHEAPLSRDRIQDVALLSYLLSEWKTKPTAASVPQPDGAIDGFGRAGFGRAGTINRAL